MSMLIGPEAASGSVILNEVFFIVPRNLEDMRAGVASRVEARERYQRVWVQSVQPPRTGFEISTERVVYPGVFTNRGQSLLFFRLLGLDPDQVERDLGIDVRGLMRSRTASRLTVIPSY